MKLVDVKDASLMYNEEVMPLSIEYRHEFMRNWKMLDLYNLRSYDLT